MSTALRLAECGQDVVLMELRFCGHGSSSRNAGQLAGAPGGDLQLLNLPSQKTMPGMMRLVDPRTTASRSGELRAESSSSMDRFSMVTPFEIVEETLFRALVAVTDRVRARCGLTGGSLATSRTAHLP
jgi:hypothetical protein